MPKENKDIINNQDGYVEKPMKQLIVGTQALLHDQIRSDLIYYYRTPTVDGCAREKILNFFDTVATWEEADIRKRT